jgi:anti-sigma-K factor RskA
MSDHEELESSVAAWVLGALEPEEAETIRSHAEACPTCREVAERLRRVVGALPLAVEEVAPPPRLRARVLAAAAASRPETARAVLDRRPGPQVRRAAPVRAGRRVPAYAMAAVAAVALLAGLLLGEVAFRGSPAPTTSQVARFTLSGHQDMSGARATVIDLRSDGVALVDFTGLPALGTGRVYELWLIPAKGNPVPAAVFVPDSNGARVVLVNRSVSGYTVMAVTNEAGPDGAPAPTQQPQLYGNLA